MTENRTLPVRTDADSHETLLGCIEGLESWERSATYPQRHRRITEVTAQLVTMARSVMAGKPIDLAITFRPAYGHAEEAFAEYAFARDNIDTRTRLVEAANWMYRATRLLYHISLMATPNIPANHPARTGASGRYHAPKSEC